MSFEGAFQLTEMPLMVGLANSRAASPKVLQKAGKGDAWTIEGNPTGVSLVKSQVLQVDGTLQTETEPPSRHAPELAQALVTQFLIGTIADDHLLPNALDDLARRTLVIPRSERWQEAISTALAGDWSKDLWSEGHLPLTAVGALKAEARMVHRQLVPVWRRRTRHGRVLSLDAVLGDGLSLYDLVAPEVDHLTRAEHGVFEDERLNAVLRVLTHGERQIVFAYAEGEGATWSEAAAFVGAPNPVATGERLRRKVKRLAAEQRRRLARRQGRRG
jgi:hypothetical protein